MRIMQFCIFFPWGPTFRSWAHFGCLLGSPGRPSWSQVGPIWISVGPLGGFLGVLGGFLGALGSLVGPIWASVEWLCAFLEALWRKSGHQLGDSVSLGVRFGFFWVSGLRIKFFALSLDAEFVGIGEAGLDICQCVSIGAQLHTKPNAHTCATYLYMCTCWSIIWHVRLLQQTIENY